MKNQIKNIVCNKRSGNLVKEIEKEIENKFNDGWDIVTIHDSMITALQNLLHNYK